MKKIIELDEYKKRFYTLMESTVGDVKPLLKEDIVSDSLTKMEGPFNNPMTSEQLFVARLDKGFCQNLNYGSDYNKFYQMTGTTCVGSSRTFPGGKFYVVGIKDGVLGLDTIFDEEGEKRFHATNGGKGYNTQEEAKMAVGRVMNPDGKTGRNVQRNEYGKIITKYDKQGNPIKQKFVSKKQDGGGRTKETIKTNL